MNNFKNLMALTASAVVLTLVTQAAQAAIGSSNAVPSIEQNSMVIAGKGNNRLSNANGTIKPGSLIAVDPSLIKNVPRSERSKLFVINKGYQVEEGVSADDLYIVDEQAGKWEVNRVDNNDRVYLESGNKTVWGLVQQF